MLIHHLNIIMKCIQSILVGGDLLRDGSSLIVMVLARGIMTFQGVEAFSVIQMADGLKAMPRRLVRAMLFEGGKTQEGGVELCFRKLKLFGS
jgi:hypothetical protein